MGSWENSKIWQSNKNQVERNGKLDGMQCNATREYAYINMKSNKEEVFQLVPLHGRRLKRKGIVYNSLLVYRLNAK